MGSHNEAEIKHNPSSNLRFFLSYLFDVVLIAFFLSFSPNTGVFPFHWAVIGIGILSALSIMVTLRRITTIKVFFILFLCLVGFGFGILRWPIAETFLLMLYFFWRAIVSLSQNSDEMITSTRLVLFMITGSGVFIGQLIFELTSTLEVLILLMTGFILYSAGAYFINLLRVKEESQINVSLKPVLYSTGLVSVWFTAAFFFSEYIRGIFYWLLNGFLYLSYPLGVLMSKVDPVETQQETTEEEESVPGENESPHFEEIARQLENEFIEVGLIALVIISAIGLIFFMKKKIAFQKQGKDLQDFSIERFKHPKRKLSDKNNKQNMPDDDLRKAIFRFEQFMAKKGFGRQRAESIREWLLRIQLSANPLFLTTYEDIRYGNKSISSTEKKEWIKEVKRLEKEAKQLKDS